MTATGPAVAVTDADALRDRALAGSGAWEILESLVTEVGARPTGSPGMAHAKDWAARKLTALGLENVHAELFSKENVWVRGAESAEILAPMRHPLRIVGLGNSATTTSKGVEAEVILFSSVSQLLRAPPNSLTGKIAFVNQPMARTQNEEGYRAAVRARTEGPALAGSRGAIAYLTRSITASASSLPHAGVTRFPKGTAPVPAAALGAADADLLARLLLRNAAVRIRLTLQSTVIPKAPAWNVVGEITGREAPEEIVLIGAHLDSWDLSESASDDGAGVAITTAAAALIAAQSLHPRRTIRLVLWGSEETEGSGAAYALAHRDEVPHIVLAAEADFGAGRAYRLMLPKVDRADPRILELMAGLAPLQVFLSEEPVRSGGSDIEDLRKAGTPVGSLNQDQTRYFDTHHSADDTLAQIDRKDLDQNVAAWTALLSTVANSDIRFERPSP